MRPNKYERRSLLDSASRVLGPSLGPVEARVPKRRRPAKAAPPVSAGKLSCVQSTALTAPGPPAYRPRDASPNSAAPSLFLFFLLFLLFLFFLFLPIALAGHRCLRPQRAPGKDRSGRSTGDSRSEHQSQTRWRACNGNCNSQARRCPYKAPRGPTGGRRCEPWERCTQGPIRRSAGPLRRSQQRLRRRNAHRLLPKPVHEDSLWKRPPAPR